MKITNNSGLPAPLVRAVTNDPYHSPTEFSVTGLIKPARIAFLESLHRDQIVEDAADRIWALLGQIGHLILERAAGDDYAEKRHTISRNGHTISGQVDLLENSIIVDYKFCSIYAAMGGVKPEWEQQCNLNALLCRANDITVTAAQIVCIFRDWSVREAARNTQYPQSQVRVLQVKLWDAVEQERFLWERLEAHIDARNVLPECTPTEVRAKPDTWAVKKSGGVRALRVYDKEADALAHQRQASGLVVEHRPGERPWCESYCRVSEWCAVWQHWKTQNQKGEAL